MRRKAFHCERASYSCPVAVFVGLVVQELKLGSCRNRGIDHLLSGDALVPPLLVQFMRFLCPRLVGIAWDLPFLPLHLQRPVQRLPEWLQLFLVLLPNDVDLGIVGYVPQGDVGHPLVDEPLPHVAVGGHLRRGAAGQLGLLELPVLAVGEDVVGIAGAHDAGAGQGQRDAGGVDGDPPTPPLLGHVGRGAGAASGVQHHVTRVGGHKDAAFYYLRVRLNDIGLVICKVPRTCVGPNISVNS